MKNFKLILIFTFGLLCQLQRAAAQKPTLKTGLHITPEDAKSNKNRFSELISGNDDEVLIADRAKNGSVITSYNSTTLKKTGTFKLDYPEVGSKDADWVKRLFHGQEITTIYGFYDKKANEVRVYGKVTDRKNKVIHKPEVLMASDSKKRKNIGNLITKFSNDGSKLLILREPAGSKYDNEKMEFVIYDNELNKISEKTLEFPYKDKSIFLSNVLITNEGHVAIVAYWAATKDELKADPSLEDQQTYKIFGVSENNETMQEIEIKNKGYVMGSCSGIVYNDTTNSMLFTGFYRDNGAGKSKRSKGVNGIYYLRLNTETWALDLQQFNTIETKTITSYFMGNKDSKRAKKRAQKAVDNGYGFSNMVLKNIFYTPEGNIKIVGQIEYVYTYCTRDPRTGINRCTNVHHNLQILEFNLNSKGELLNSVVIPKNQLVSVSSQPIGGFGGVVSISYNVPIGEVRVNYLGSLCLMGEDKTYYIYNDAEKNFNEKKIAKQSGNRFAYGFTGSKKSRLCFVSVDEKGKLSKQPMVNSWKQNMFIYPADAVRVNENTIVTFAKLRKAKELLLVRVSLDDKNKKDN